MVLNYSRNCSLHATLIPNLAKPPNNASIFYWPIIILDGSKYFWVASTFGKGSKSKLQYVTFWNCQKLFGSLNSFKISLQIASAKVLKMAIFAKSQLANVPIAKMDLKEISAHFWSVIAMKRGA